MYHKGGSSMEVEGLLPYPMHPLPKVLPSVALGIQHTATIYSAKACLPSVFHRALGKHFAECLDGPQQKKVCATEG